jgi:soluble lytic murein transglycosylase-like protein
VRIPFPAKTAISFACAISVLLPSATAITSAGTDAVTAAPSTATTASPEQESAFAYKVYAPYVTAAPTAVPTATALPTASPVVITKEKEKQLIAAEKSAATDVVYDTANDYFGADVADVSDNIITITVPTVLVETAPSAAVATPEPTQAPTPEPTAVPTQEPTAVPTLIPSLEPSSSSTESLPTSESGETSGKTASSSVPSASESVASSAAPEATIVPTPAPTLAPTLTLTAELQATAAPTLAATQAPAAQGPVLQVTDSAYTGLSPISRYNAWDSSLKAYAYQAAKAYGVPYELVLAIINNESGFNASATHINKNGTTDWGLCQINDICIPFVAKRVAGVSVGSDLLDPYKNIQACCAILAYHLARSTSIDEALLKYQVGEGNARYYIQEGTYPAVFNRVKSYEGTYINAGV